VYFDGLSFLDEEREAWRPYERLLGLPDEALADQLADCHGWSGRDLMAHLVAWQEHALAVARELAVNETSPTRIRGDQEWAARGDAINEEIRLAWLELPMDEVRRRMTAIPGELRGTLTVVPESRWLKNSDHLRFFLDETTDHYEAHMPDLQAVLGAAGALA